MEQFSALPRDQQSMAFSTGPRHITAYTDGSSGISISEHTRRSGAVRLVLRRFRRSISASSRSPCYTLHIEVCPTNYQGYSESTSSQSVTMLGSYIIFLAQSFLLVMATEPDCETKKSGKPETPEKIKITAISAANGASTLECWELLAPFQIASEAGVAGAASAPLTDAGNVTYTIIPPKFDGGLHNAPRVQ